MEGGSKKFPFLKSSTHAPWHPVTIIFYHNNQAVKESEFPANDRAEAERERKEKAKSMEERKSSTDESSDQSDSEQCSDVDKSDVQAEEMPKTTAANGSEKSIKEVSLTEPILKEEVPINR